MFNLYESNSSKVGLPPGSLVYVGPERTDQINISIIDYNKNTLQEKNSFDVKECFSDLKLNMKRWIHISGMHDESIIEAIGNHFNINHLILEDILNTNHRPKIEIHDNFIFVIMKFFYYDSEDSNKIIKEHLCIILGKNFIISFQEGTKDVFSLIKKRIKLKDSKIRKFGVDYLTYCIIDTIIDYYLNIADIVNDKIEDLEEDLINNSYENILNTIYELKREIIHIRRVVTPVRNIVNDLEKTDSLLISKSLSFYLRDLYDHTLQIVEQTEIFKELLTGLLDTYHSSLSNKMNEIMKVLTIISTLFIPLSFVTGLYGMNFHYIPELEWHYGYFFVLCIIIVAASSMILYFKKKKWL
ncbi:MAG: magnesium/cobalt transporter CorA [Desulfobacterales bacterium]|nr:magnesium/cobalt transporter CorA [Desulfobacterales bacterium]